MNAQVPIEASSRDLSVSLQPHQIRVAHARTGEVYLEGRLWRGIVPQESVWMLGGGTGEDGLLMLLRKMNLELLCRRALEEGQWTWSRRCISSPAEFAFV